MPDAPLDLDAIRAKTPNADYERLVDPQKEGIPESCITDGDYIHPCERGTLMCIRNHSWDGNDDA